MDIGKKLRDARNAAKLTQESAAESLGVSRQTISNWETGKTYPDKRSQLSQRSRREHKRRQEPPQTRKARARRRISRHMGGVGRVFLARRLRVGRGRVRRARYMGRNPADHIRHLAAHRHKRLLGQKKMVGGAYPRSYVHSHSVSDLHPCQRRFDGHFRRRHNDAP